MKVFIFFLACTLFVVESSTQNSSSDDEVSISNSTHTVPDGIIYQKRIIKSPSNSQEICITTKPISTCAVGWTTEAFKNKTTRFLCRESNNNNIEADIAALQWRIEQRGAGAGAEIRAGVLEWFMSGQSFKFRVERVIKCSMTNSILKL